MTAADAAIWLAGGLIYAAFNVGLGYWLSLSSTPVSPFLGGSMPIIALFTGGGPLDGSKWEIREPVPFIEAAPSPSYRMAFAVLDSPEPPPDPWVHRYRLVAAGSDGVCLYRYIGCI